MNVKEAVKIAARYVAELEGVADGMALEVSADQVLRDIRFAVEGTRYDDSSNRWDIEVGFARRWDQASASPLAGLAGSVSDKRTFKTVVIDDETGKVLSYGGK